MMQGETEGQTNEGMMERNTKRDNTWADETWGGCITRGGESRDRGECRDRKRTNNR